MGAGWGFANHLFSAFLSARTDIWACVCFAPTGRVREEQEEAPALPQHWETKEKRSLHLPLIILRLSGTCPLTTPQTEYSPKPKKIMAGSLNTVLGAYGGTEMLNTSSMFIYLWLLQPTVTTSNNWIALSVAGLICYLIIKPGPLLIMASLETRRLREKCIQGAMLTLKAHVALGAEQDLCQMQILYLSLLKHALCGLLCLWQNIYQLWQGCYLAFWQRQWAQCIFP